MARARMAEGTTARIRRKGMQPAQWLAGLLAVALLVLGIWGFTRTGVTNWSTSNTTTLIGFHLNAVRNLIYVVGGVVGILLALLAGTARLYGWLVLIGSVVLVLWGLALVGTFSSNPVSGLGNPLRLAASDNWWHAGAALLGLIVAVLPARRVIVADEPADTFEPDGPVEHADPGAHPGPRHRVGEPDDQPIARPTERAAQPADAAVPAMAPAETGDPADADATPARRAHWWSPRRHPGYR